MTENRPDAQIKRQLAEADGLCRSGRYDAAKGIYMRLTALMPSAAEPYLGCGRIAMSSGDYDEAAYWFRRACAVRPDLPAALEGTGSALLALGQPEEALKIFEHMENLDPKSDAAFHGAGQALSQLGRLTEARQAFERAVLLAPDFAGHHYELAGIGRFGESDPRLAGLKFLAKKIASLPEEEQVELHFALAKADDDRGRWDEAFSHFQAGNALKRRRIAYDEAMFLGILRDLAAAFPREVVDARRGAGDPSEVPVFVVGMPRSGTSLIEQIIASHPDAAGIGESMYLHRLLGQNLAGADFPAHFSAVPNEALRRLGSLYVSRLKAMAPGAKRVVDKLPANFMLCGLIHLALPKARIVHAMRDPLDTCFSCYANLFSQHIDYSYDLGELGRYYRAYAALMAHWRRVLPAGVMLDVSYENLVENFEAEARRLVAFCGLGWDARCLDFYKTKRVVHTLSAAQVRRPIYRTAVGRAAPYRPWLGPLIAALAGAV